MKIAIYTDYFNGLPNYGGGGETFAIYMAKVLSENNEVTMFSNKVDDKLCNLQDVFKYYEINDDTINKIKFKFAPTIGWEAYRYKRENHAHKFLNKELNNFDLFINCSDNTLRGFKNKVKSIKINHFPWAISYPWKKPFSKNFYMKRYINSYNLFLCNSNFTCGWHKKIHGIPAQVLYPPINQKALEFADINNKEDIIISVGRIIEQKKITQMADVFKKINNKFGNYKLIIVGNYRDEDNAYLKDLKLKLHGTNYELICNAKQDVLDNLYKKSKIFWSLKGLNTDDPLAMEHFGMTTVEAMANGCAPIVCNKAGSKEIVDESFGYKINDINELYNSTLELIKSPRLFHDKSIASIKASKQYLLPQFGKNINQYINNIFN